MNILNDLPKPDDLNTKAKALAILDAIYCQEWDMRYFSHNAKWAENQQMSSMRNGEGNDYFLIHAPYGCAIKGNSSASRIAAGGAFFKSVERQIPARFAEFMAEPAFSMDQASFVLWFDEDAQAWRAAASDDAPGDADDGGQAELLKWLCKGPEFYRSWAEEYYGVDVDLTLVNRAFNYQPISIAYIESLSIPIDRATLSADFEEIGFPFTA